MQEGVSPTGARTYSIPIITAPGARLAPLLALCYNSQTAEGLAGYGWDLQGISAIRLINKSKFWHGETKGADVYSRDAAFALDGEPLVKNNQIATCAAFPLRTASGNILVAPNRSRGFVTFFTVKYPDGSTAIFGTGDENEWNKPSYPIISLTDKNGDRIEFEYWGNTDGCDDRIKKIRYGFTPSGSNFGEIDFEYAYNSGHPIHHFAGKTVFRSRRLTGISTMSGKDTLCRFTLDYMRQDNVWLLTQICCSSDGERLPPITFEYGSIPYDSTTPGKMYQSRSLLLSRAFESTEDRDFVYKRGKFVRGSYSDGLLIYPNLSTYDWLHGREPKILGEKTYQYGSPYPAAQKILFAASVEDFTGVDNGITAGDGFQTIEAADIDGDGVDELVKINLDGVEDGSSKVLITIFECSPFGSPVQSSQFSVELNGTITSGDYVSPYRRAWFWGDFLGNGKAQILAIAYDKNWNAKRNYSQNCYASLIDIDAKTKLCDAELFDFPLSKTAAVITCDIDADGKTELCRATSSGLEVWRFGTGFSMERTLDGLTESVLCDTSRICFITDLNGDGYIDVMRSPVKGSNLAFWHKYSFDGHVFTKNLLQLSTREEGDSYLFLDVNRDGNSDLLRIRNSRLGTFINLNGSSFATITESIDTLADARGIVPVNVIDRQGASAFIKVDGAYAREYSYTYPSPQLRQLAKSMDSSGKVVLNDYTYLPSHGCEWTEGEDAPALPEGYSYKSLPIHVLLREVAYQDASYSHKHKERSYIWSDAVSNDFGLGFCGFSRIRVYDMADGVTLLSEEVHDPARRGAVTQTFLRLGSRLSSPYHVAVNTYEDEFEDYGKPGPRLAKCVEVDSLMGVVTTTSITYGDYSQPSTVLTSRKRAGDAAAKTRKLSRSYINKVSASEYMLGLVSEESLIREGDGDTKFSWKEKAVNNYDSYGRLTNTKRYVGKYGTIVFGGLNPIRDSLPNRQDDDAGDGLTPIGSIPKRGLPTDTTLSPLPNFIHYDATNLVSEIRFEYDSLGHVISRMTAPYGTDGYTGSTYSYDADGRYVETETDNLGHTISYASRDKFGNPLSSTDWMQRTTRRSFDAWGNEVSVSLPDGTLESTVRKWGGDGLYTVSRMITGRPESVSHFDALGREVRSGSLRFNGDTLWTVREYDARGLLTKESLPFRKDSSILWTEYTYDSYGRQVSATEASGNATSWSYDGTSVTKVRDGVSSTITTDAEGNVVSATDPGGTVSYVLRDDAQPSGISAPGGAVTSFTYDDYARRTKITDPGAGTITESYIWNSDGSSVLVRTGSHGTLKTHRDKYGRTTLVEGTGGLRASYSYDSRGLLVSEQSAGGSSAEYTYDGFDRIETAKLTVPGGKWLLEVYGYGAGSTLKSIRYQTREGWITTEQYSYGNGTLTEVSLPDGSAVWKLEDENNLGLPSRITTGLVTREYSYTPYGAPASRRIERDGDALQDFSYLYSTATGNLLSRSDAVCSTEENFGYDNLNRLASMGSRQISYASNGNILSIDGSGTLAYGNASRPYGMTAFTPEEGVSYPYSGRIVSYDVADRPSAIAQGSLRATFDCDGSGQRVRMRVEQDSTYIFTRLYIGDCFERDSTADGSLTERLYLGGDAYSAPMVYVRENGGSWTAYNIGRDNLGSITHIATSDGSLVAEYSYDAWGRQRNPQTLELYPAGQEPTLLLGRGFTGHEHLSGFGLINMNARLYDSYTGRFLSPDPFVQDPYSSQSLNRFSYALNNPLKYTDESGEYIGWDDIAAALIGGTVNWVANGAKFSWEGLSYFGIGAAAGVASLYVSPVITSGLMAGANSIVNQGFGGNNGWNWNNVNFAKAGFASIMGAATSYLGGALSSTLSSSLGSLTSRIPGKAWTGIVNRGVTGYATGFTLGAFQTALSEYGETGSVSWSDVISSANVSGLVGLTTGAVSGMAEGIREAKILNENPWALSESDINPANISIKYPSLGAKSKPFNAKKISDNYLEQNGLNAHEIKYEYLGSSTAISRYDLYLSKEGQIIIYGRHGVGEGYLLHIGYIRNSYNMNVSSINLTVSSLSQKDIERILEFQHATIAREIVQKDSSYEACIISFKTTDYVLESAINSMCDYLHAFDGCISKQSLCDYKLRLNIEIIAEDADKDPLPGITLSADFIALIADLRINTSVTITLSSVEPGRLNSGAYFYVNSDNAFDMNRLCSIALAQPSVIYRKGAMGRHKIMDYYAWGIEIKNDNDFPEKPIKTLMEHLHNAKEIADFCRQNKLDSHVDVTCYGIPTGTISFQLSAQFFSFLNDLGVMFLDIDLMN